VLAKHIAQVFYIPNTTNKRLKMVIPGIWWIIRVENAVDEEVFYQFDEIPPFVNSMIKPRIPLANEAPYFCNDHYEKVKNFKKIRLQRNVAKWLCKICSMCENMVICVKMWLVLDICVKYAQCVKIWPSLDICVKYSHLISWLRFWSVCSFWSLVFSSWCTLY
jgi:hypothetical protein